MPIAFARSSAGKTAVMIDSVEGMMNAPPMPIRARVAISISGEVASADRPEPRPKMARPMVSAALAAEAVAERAGGEQQAGEDEHVGVDDPLQLGAGCAEVALERRQRDVEDGVVEPDHEQRRGEDDERPPAPGIGLGTSGGGEENETVPFRFMGGKVHGLIAKRNRSVPLCPKGQADGGARERVAQAVAASAKAMRISVPPPSRSWTSRLCVICAISGSPRPSPGLSVRGSIPRPSSATSTTTVSASQRARTSTGPGSHGPGRRGARRW